MPGPLTARIGGVELVVSRLSPVLLLLLGVQSWAIAHLLTSSGLPVAPMPVLVPALLALHLLGVAVHEGGHVLVGRLLGQSWRRLRLSPLGVAVGLGSDGDGQTARQRLVISLSGPALGLVWATVTGYGTVLAWGTPLGTLLLGATIATVLDNLLNLTPFIPASDGHRALTASVELMSAGFRSTTARTPAPAEGP